MKKKQTELEKSSRSYLKKLVVVVNLVLSLAIFTTGQTKGTKHGEPGLYSSYHGLVMAGYQGWFRAPGDGRGETWGHYGRADQFNDENISIDVWPDVSEYDKTYKTSFKHENGEPAYVFSSYDKSTVYLHFKWMKEYGIDGVHMQRFYGDTKPGKRRKIKTQILKYALDASEKYGRAISVMYDLSGLKPGGSVQPIINDWKKLVDELKVTKRETYLYHDGKPFVAVWGIGFPDRPYDVRNGEIMRLINFLKNDPEYGGCTVMFGVPTYWRTLNKDSNKDPYIHEVIKRADMIMPWMVQRFHPYLHHELGERGFNRYRDIILADMQWCRKNDIEYVANVHPGFSWYNISHNNPGMKNKPVGSIPRREGKFYWNQISTAIRCGADQLYVAMFDEIDEGTAIFKISDNPPVSEKANFLDLDTPPDLYLWLTGQGAKMLRGEKPLSKKMPARK